MEPYDLTYFHIGFRSENSIQALNKLKKEGIYRGDFLKDAYEIISNCCNILNNKIDFYEPKIESKYKAYRELVVGDLEKLILNPKRNEILLRRKRRIKEVKSIIGKILVKKPVTNKSLNSAIDYFKELSEKCQSYSFHQASF